MNSSPKQKPFLDRTIAVIFDWKGVSNSTSSKSPGFSRIPAYRTMPPSLISVPRPATTVVEKPLAVTTRTGISTGRRSQRREFWGAAISRSSASLISRFKLRRYSASRRLVRTRKSLPINILGTRCCNPPATLTCTDSIGLLMWNSLPERDPRDAIRICHR